VNNAFAKWTILAAALLLLLPACALAADAVGRVTRTQGLVMAQDAVGARGLSLGDAVTSGDVVATGVAARAEITFNDGTVVTLSDESEFVVRLFDTGKGTARFELVRGAFRAVTGSITRVAAPDFEVKTPLATIGIRGTDFWGGFLPGDKNLSVLMISGKSVTVKNASGVQELTQAGQGVTVPATGPATGPAAGDAPKTPTVWPKKKVDKAVRTVTFVKAK